jgi:hypothetical protein
MTDNAFQVREECDILKYLDELIDIRNKIVHPKPRFYRKVTKHKIRPKKQRAKDHPFSFIKMGDCRRYYTAVRRFDRLFFEQYDRGRIKENRLIKEIPRILNQDSR